MDGLGTIDAILDAHAGALGADRVPYGHHAHRVAALCRAHLAGGAETMGEKVAVAAAFHDLGIWTHRTFDYLEPSVGLATAWLTAAGRDGWVAEIAETIRQHHKITPWRGDAAWIVEPFRRADWTDVTLGARRFGVPKARIAAIYSVWPAIGFHRRLVQLELAHLRRHPFDPLPVLKL